MMKIYYTNLGNLTTFVQVKGKKRYVDFISSDNKTGYFSTDNEPLQQALERDPAFGGRYKLHKKIGEAAEPKTVLTPVEHILNWQQAREWLSGEPYNIPLKKMPNSTSIRKEAEGLGLCFPKIKQ